MFRGLYAKRLPRTTNWQKEVFVERYKFEFQCKLLAPFC